MIDQPYTVEPLVPDETSDLPETTPRRRRSGAAARSRSQRADDVHSSLPDDDPRPAIDFVAGRIPEAVDGAEAALIEARAAIYARAGSLVRPVTETVPAADDRTTVVTKFRAMCPASMADHASRAMRFRRYDKRSEAWVVSNPPGEIIAALLAREGEWRLPAVAGIATTPTLRPDGSLLAVPGYDPATRLFLAVDPGFRLPRIRDRPGRAEAVRALRLLQDLVAGFPFVSLTDQAVALSSILTAVGRGALPVSPLYGIRAHTPGSGKSYLVDVVSAIATGRRCPVITAGKTDEETEKRLGSLLRDAVPVVSIDNVEAPLGGDMLCQMTERPLVRVRILGRSEAPELECRSTVFATGNNLVLVGDMTRRAVLCTLDAGVERPELRAFDFLPVERVLADRGAYVAAALTIARAYQAAGCPNVVGTIGSYGAWSTVARAPLVWLGLPDPVASMEAARAEDPKLSAIRELFEHWHASLIESAAYSVNGIIQVACERTLSADGGPSEFRAPEFRDLLLRQAGTGGVVNSNSLGMWLKGIAGRPVSGWRLDVEIDPKRGNKYRLSRQAQG